MPVLSSLSLAPILPLRSNEDLAASFPPAHLVFSSSTAWLVPPYNYLFHMVGGCLAR